MQVDFYRKIKTLNKKWESELKQFLKKYSSEKVLIILFGSRSRGDHNILSDFDIVFISENEIEEPKIDFPCDLFMYTIAEVFELLKTDNFIVKNALSNGQILLDNLDKTGELLKIANI